MSTDGICEDYDVSYTIFSVRKPQREPRHFARGIRRLYIYWCPCLKKRTETWCGFLQTIELRRWIVLDTVHPRFSIPSIAHITARIIHTYCARGDIQRQLRSCVVYVSLFVLSFGTSFGERRDEGFAGLEFGAGCTALPGNEEFLETTWKHRCESRCKLQDWG